MRNPQDQAMTPTELPGWQDYVDSLRPIGERVLGKGWEISDSQAIQETYRALFAALAQGHLDYVCNDPRYPDWMPGYDVALNLAAPVPDFRYKVTLIEGDGVYRIAGFRGTSRFVDITIFTSLYSLGTRGPVAGRVSLDELELGPNGEFELILSGTRPEGYSGDWRPLDARAIRLQVRHACYDWLNEVDARMGIERLDTPAARPRDTAEQIAARLSKLATWAQNTVAFGTEHVAQQASKGVINRLQPIDWGAAGGFDAKIQAYMEGCFELQEDEALILETEIPERVRYWSFLLSDCLFQTVDWMNHQSSINGHQARIDADGRFRAVVSLRDPGVPNWLDTGGHRRGVIQVRWNEYSSAPVPAARKVPLSAVRSLLPPDTPHIGAAERERALRLRRLGAQLRSRW
jgi:hypothetical protein